MHPPLLVLIDTEGFDCKIILGISKRSAYLPNFLVFEHKQCGADRTPAVEHMKGMGYTVASLNHENTFAFLNR